MVQASFMTEHSPMHCDYKTFVDHLQFAVCRLQCMALMMIAICNSVLSLSFNIICGIRIRVLEFLFGMSA